MIDARGILLSIIGIALVSLALNAFFLDMAINSGVSTDGLNTTIFNKTKEITGIGDKIRNETSFLEDIPIIGDIVAIMGNAVKGMRFIYSAPEYLITMVTETASVFFIPPWIIHVFIGMIIVFVIFMFLYFMRGYQI